jgi:cell division protein FtsN
MEQVNRLVLSRTDPAVISKITQTLEMILDNLTSVEQRQDQLNEEQDIIMERMEAITASLAAPAPSSIMTTGNAANGTWAINLASARTQREAEDFLKQIEALGHAAELHSVKVNGRDWIRVRIVGLPNRSVARALLDEVQRHHPFKTAWMDRQ